MNIVEPIFVQCRNKPAEIALVAPGTELNLVSYGRLARSINNVCRRAIAANLSAGNRVAVFIEDKILHAIILLALTRLGIVTISGRNKNFSKRLGIDAVISDKSFLFPADKIILADFDWISGDDQPLDSKYIHRAAPDDLCRIFLTSGTTGEEKAVAVTHRMLAERIARQNLHFGSTISFSSRVFVDLGLTTSLGFQLLIAMLWRGGALFVAGDDQATISSFPIYKVQGMIVAPGGLAEVLDAVERRPQYECRFDAIWTGGSSLPKALSDRARIRLSSNLTIAYGSTEATMVASMPAQFSDGAPGAVGYVFPGINVEITDNEGSPLEVGKEGIVRIKSRWGATEYLGDPEESARAFRDGWFYPGDIGYLTNDNMLVISGRANSVMNLGGEKVSPEKIEEVLLAHPRIAQAAVLAMLSDLGLEQHVYALIVPRSDVDANELRAHCLANMPAKFVPSRFITVNEIPKNDTGKIDRQRIPELMKSKLN